MRGRILITPAAALLILSSLHAVPADTADTVKRRQSMVATQIEARGIRDPRVLRAMRDVPRHFFVPQELERSAYQDSPLPIGEGQTISQPYIVALMTELLGVEPGDRVLEVGTGSGYQAAVLARLTDHVYSVEIKEALYRRAVALLAELRIEGISLRLGDGYWGWPEAAPFDGIMITAAVDHIPRPLLAQIKEGGKIVLPLGNPFQYQNLVVVTRTSEGPVVDIVTGVLFVPMTGTALD